MVIIIGAGLSGLLTANLLKKEGIPFKILEARNRLGGRIHTINDKDNAPIEMGATWFYPQHKHLIHLLEELKVDYFKQSMNNTAFYEASIYSGAQLIQLPTQPPSYRISGGTSSIINALYKNIDATDVYLNQSVSSIKFNKEGVYVIADNTFEGSMVVLALPPKLWANNIVFEPGLPTELMSVAKQCHTWMEDSIKVALTYNTSFWGLVDLPGTLFSNSGPVTEFYDHSNHEKSKFALCGFIDSSLKNLSFENRQERVLTQLKTVFGSAVEKFTSYNECLWSNEKNTYVPTENFLLPHQNNGHSVLTSSYFEDRLFIAGTESTSEFPGYMDGAVFSANRVVEKIVTR